MGVTVTKMTVRLNDEDLEKLVELGEKEYKRRGDNAKVIRWLIQDMWEIKCGLTLRKLEKL